MRLCILGVVHGPSFRLLIHHQCVLSPVGTGYEPRALISPSSRIFRIFCSIQHLPLLLPLHKGYHSIPLDLSFLLSLRGSYLDNFCALHRSISPHLHLVQAPSDNHLPPSPVAFHRFSPLPHRLSTLPHRPPCPQTPPIPLALTSFALATTPNGRATS